MFVGNDIYGAICSVCGGNTDFDVGFDVLFEFMCDHPEAITTKNFIEYHIYEMGDPRLADGRPEFTYLIGKHFIVDDWVSEEERYAFIEFAKLRILENLG